MHDAFTQHHAVVIGIDAYTNWVAEDRKFKAPPPSTP
jgi:hypothetical protein